MQNLICCPFITDNKSNKGHPVTWTNPHLGTDLGGLCKIRMAITSKGRSKSGGARVIPFTRFVAVDETEINLLYIYDKTERESIPRME